MIVSGVWSWISLTGSSPSNVCVSFVFPCLLMINDVYELRRSYFVGFLDWLFVYNLAGFTFAVSVYKISVDVTSILSILGSS